MGACVSLAVVGFDVVVVAEVQSRTMTDPEGVQCLNPLSPLVFEYPMKMKLFGLSLAETKLFHFHGI